jgi:phospholipid/cholesterol/gamma-HCH transport system substrate-binding protein
MSTRAIEITVGLFVAAGMLAFFMLAMKASNLVTFSGDGGYSVSASFENIGGLQVRSPVKAGGVTVGRVASIQYDSDTYQAKIIMQIDNTFDQFPVDTSASILTAGLLGEQYIGLEPGAEEEYLEDGDSLQLTESAMVLERLIGQFLYQKASGE